MVPEPACGSTEGGATCPKSFAENAIAACKRAAKLFRPLPDRLRKVSRLVREPGRFLIVVHLFLVVPARKEKDDVSTFPAELTASGA